MYISSSLVSIVDTLSTLMWFTSIYRYFWYLYISSSPVSIVDTLFILSHCYRLSIKLTQGKIGSLLFIDTCGISTLQTMSDTHILSSESFTVIEVHPTIVLVDDFQMTIIMYLHVTLESIAVCKANDNERRNQKLIAYKHIASPLFFLNCCTLFLLKT